MGFDDARRRSRGVARPNRGQSRPFVRPYFGRRSHGCHRIVIQFRFHAAEQREAIAKWIEGALDGKERGFRSPVAAAGLEGGLELLEDKGIGRALWKAAEPVIEFVEAAANVREILHHRVGDCIGVAGQLFAELFLEKCADGVDVSR
jgi:hypothetical protein